MAKPASNGGRRRRPPGGGTRDDPLRRGYIAAVTSDRPVCAGLFETPMVHVDGDVTTCCLDEHLENRLGNVRATPLATLWSGPTLRAWRLAQAEGRFERSGPYCTRCNWASAGAMSDDAVERWLSELGETAILRRYRTRRGRA